MAETFAIDSGQVVQGQSAQAGQTRASGGASVGFSGGAGGVRSDGTVDALLKLGAASLAPKIQAAKQEQFMAGVAAAQQGAAVQDIDRDQPWYSQIFGPSAATAGARAYTTQAAIAKWGADMESQMPKLAEMDPQQMQQVALGSLRGMQTGDPETDALITSAAVEQFAPLFKQHAKAHYAFTQNKAMVAQADSWMSMGSAFQSQMASPYSTPEDRKAAGDRLLGNLMPFGDQTDDSFNKQITGLLQNSARAGNFHVVKLMKTTLVEGPDGKAQSLYDRIPADQRAALDQALPALARDVLNNSMPKYALDLEMIVRDTAQDPRLVGDRLDALNEKVAQETGITEAEFFPKSSWGGVVGNILSAQAAERNRKDPKTTIDLRPQLAAGLVDRPGMLQQAIDLNQIEASHAKQAMATLWVERTDPKQRAAMLNAQPLSGGTPFINQDITMTMNTQDWTPGVTQTAGMYANLSEPAKMSYFNDAQRSILDRFQMAVRSGVPEKAAWLGATLEHPAAANLPNGEMADYQNAVAAVIEKNNENIIGWNKVNDAGMRAILAVGIGAYKEARTLNETKVAASRAYHYAMANGAFIMGEYGGIQDKNTSNKNVAVLIGEGQKATNDAFDRVMKDKAKFNGVNLDNYTLFRTPDRGGKAYFLVTADDGAGKLKTWTIGSDDIKAGVVKEITPPKPMAPAKKADKAQGAQELNETLRSMSNPLAF